MLLKIMKFVLTFALSLLYVASIKLFTSPMTYCLQPDKLVECFQYFLQGLGLGTIIATCNPCTGLE